MKFPRALLSKKWCCVALVAVAVLLLVSSMKRVEPFGACDCCTAAIGQENDKAKADAATVMAKMKAEAEAVAAKMKKEAEAAVAKMKTEAEAAKAAAAKKSLCQTCKQSSECINGLTCFGYINWGWLGKETMGRCKRQFPDPC